MTGAVPAVDFRDMHWSDIPDLASLEQVLHPHDPWSQATWWSELAGRPRRDYQVLTGPDTRVLGYAGLDLAGDVADVMTISVDPAQQGKGLGSRLLERLHTRASLRGAETMLLEVRADNTAAIRLYENYGYRRIHTRRGYYQAGQVDALVMQAVLASPKATTNQEKDA